MNTVTTTSASSPIAVVHPLANSNNSSSSSSNKPTSVWEDVFTSRVSAIPSEERAAFYRNFFTNYNALSFDGEQVQHRGDQEPWVGEVSIYINFGQRMCVIHSSSSFLAPQLRGCPRQETLLQRPPGRSQVSWDDPPPFGEQERMHGVHPLSAQGEGQRQRHHASLQGNTVASSLPESPQ